MMTVSGYGDKRGRRAVAIIRDKCVALFPDSRHMSSSARFCPAIFSGVIYRTRRSWRVPGGSHVGHAELDDLAGQHRAVGVDPCAHRDDRPLCRAHARARHHPRRGPCGCRRPASRGALARRRGGGDEGAQQGRPALAGPPRGGPAHRARVRARRRPGDARLAGLPGPAAQAPRGDHADRGRLQEMRRGAAAPARLGRSRRRGRADQERRRGSGAEDPRRDPPVGRAHPRQVHQRIPPRLRGAARHSRGVPPVLALDREDAETGRQEDVGPRGQRGDRGRADEEIPANRLQDRRGAVDPVELRLHAVQHRRDRPHGGAGRRVHQLQADRAADVGNGRRRRLPHRVAAHLGSGRARHHPRRGVDGTVPDGGAAHHAPLPAHRQPERPRAAPHGLDLARAAGDARRHRGGPGADARHADRRQAGAAAVARHGAGGGGDRRLGGAHPDGRPDAARLHPAVRARLRGGPARIVHPLGAEHRRVAVCRPGPDSGIRAARPRESRAAHDPPAAALLRSPGGAAADGRAPGEVISRRRQRR